MLIHTFYPPVEILTWACLRFLYLSALFKTYTMRKSVNCQAPDVSLPLAAENKDYRPSRNNRKVTCVLPCSEPAPVITGHAEGNQEGTLCGFDKQARSLSKHCSHGLRPRWLCPPTGPAAAPYYLSSLKSDCMSGQLCQNKRADENAVGILTDCRRCQSPPEEKPATFHKQVQTCGPPGAAACRQIWLLGAPGVWLIWRQRACSALLRQSFWLKPHITVIYSVLCTSCRACVKTQPTLMRCFSPSGQKCNH